MNIDIIPRCIDDLQREDISGDNVMKEIDNKLLESIRVILQEEQNTRPTADELVKATDTQKNRRYFCCEKCLDLDKPLHGERRPSIRVRILIN
jgi:hypothetical protein